MPELPEVETIARKLQPDLVGKKILSADLPAARRGMANLLGSSSGSVRGELESLARKLNITI